MYSESVVPFYSFDTITKKYQSVGSAVLILHRSNIFFITAAHVIESLREHKTFIYFEHTLYELGGFPAYLSDCSLFSSRNDDPFDLAAIPLPVGLVEKCDITKCITVEQHLAGMLISSQFYQAIGYPHSKNTKAVNRTVRIPGMFRTEAIRYTVTEFGNQAFPYKSFDESFHIATCLTKTGKFQCTGENTNIPDLNGISGGLLQKVAEYNPITDNFDYAYPAGIILEKKRDNSALYSLRLVVVFEWLDLHWKDILNVS